jgi:hypothetical protein
MFKMKRTLLRMLTGNREEKLTDFQEDILQRFPRRFLSYQVTGKSEKCLIHGTTYRKKGPFGRYGYFLIEDSIKEGYVPVSAIMVMQGRLYGYESFGHEKNNPCYFGDLRLNWLGIENITGDCMALHPDGSGKIIFEGYKRIFQSLTDLGSKSIVKDNVTLSESEFHNIPGIYLSRAELGEATSYEKNKFTKGYVTNNPVWIALARGDVQLLKDYFDYVDYMIRYGEVSCTFEEKERCMDVNISVNNPISRSKVPILSPIQVGRVYFGSRLVIIDNIFSPGSSPSVIPIHLLKKCERKMKRETRFIEL